MKLLHAKVNRGDERMIAVAQHHAANTEHRAANTMQPITARRKGGGEFNRSYRPRSVTTVVWSNPLAASST